MKLAVARNRTAGAMLFVAGTAIAVFAATLTHGFAFDDVSEVVRNEYIRSLANLPLILSSGAWDGAGETNAIYRPLTSATYALNFAVAGLSPAGFHAVNVVAHAGVTALVLALALRLGLAPVPATAAALLFAVHPLHVEVAANIAGRKDALATLFVLAAVLGHATAVRRGASWLALAPVALALALLSKESGAAALVIVVAWDLLPGREAALRHRSRTAALYSLYVLTFALYLVARHASVGSFGVPLANIPFVENPLAHAGHLERVLTAVAVLGKGLWLHVWPHPLSPDYSYEAIPLVRSALDPRFLGAAFAIVALLALALAAWRRAPTVTFLIAWYGASVFATSNLVIRVGTAFGERLLYMASVAFCVAVGLAAHTIASPVRQRAALALTGVVALIFAGKTIAYAASWADEISLFTAAVDAQPRSAKSHALLGAAYMEQERIGEGIVQLEASVEILRSLPEVPAEAALQLGVAYERAGRLADASRVYEDVLRHHPGDANTLWRLGNVRWSEGREVDAVVLWQRAIVADPGHARALSDLGIAAANRGDMATAEALWTRAVQVDPRAAGAWLALGNLHESRGDLARARDAWGRFVDAAGYGAYTRERAVILEKLHALDAGARR